MTTVTLRQDLSSSRPTPLHGWGWITWRQHRVALAGVIALLGGISVFFLFHGLAMHHDYTAIGLGSCGDINGQSCEPLLELFSNKYNSWAQFLPRFLEFIPCLIGMFIGAPLVARELESGTFRFLWTQGSNRGRWIVTELAILGATLTVTALGFSAVFSWWFGPWESIMGRMVGGQAYEVAGVVFAARTLFAFMLGAMLGALIRRTVPAMAATGAIWLAVTWPTVIYLRPLIQKPVTARDDTSLQISTSWTLSAWRQDPAGHRLSQSQLAAVVQRARLDGVTSDKSFIDWLNQRGYTSWVSYQPDSRFWHFQTIEAGTYTFIALLLAGVTIWFVRRRAA